ncbi:hypothetical protein [Paraburkholderia unamae]|uniref:hypothetical protein n=1 Tax=Paraburkholderia unamae TaxID=219649 RepID=UPI000DD45B2A|nr:hypothetical protein [Paraburkholderia unamae]
MIEFSSFGEVVNWVALVASDAAPKGALGEAGKDACKRLEDIVAGDATIAPRRGNQASATALDARPLFEQHLAAGLTNFLLQILIEARDDSLVGVKADDLWAAKTRLIELMASSAN